MTEIVHFVLLHDNILIKLQYAVSLNYSIQDFWYYNNCNHFCSYTKRCAYIKMHEHGHRCNAAIRDNNFLM